MVTPADLTTIADILHEALSNQIKEGNDKITQAIKNVEDFLKKLNESNSTNQNQQSDQDATTIKQFHESITNVVGKFHESITTSIKEFNQSTKDATNKGTNTDKIARLNQLHMLTTNLLDQYCTTAKTEINSTLTLVHNDINGSESKILQSLDTAANDAKKSVEMTKDNIITTLNKAIADLKIKIPSDTSNGFTPASYVKFAAKVGKVMHVYKYAIKAVSGTSMGAKFTRKVLRNVKRNPYLGLGVGVILGLGRVISAPHELKSYGLAAAEIASGALSCVPGPGTVASCIVDGALLCHDLRDK